VSTCGRAVGLLFAVLVAGCGGATDREAPDRPPPDPSPGDRRAVEAVARQFADAVNRARPAELCTLLRGRAHVQQGCGTEGEDIGPLLQLAIDSRSDVRVASVTADTAIVHIPSPRIPAEDPAIPKGAGPPQVLHLRRIGGRWLFTHLELRDPRDASPAKHNYASADS